MIVAMWSYVSSAMMNSHMSCSMFEAYSHCYLVCCSCGCPLHFLCLLSAVVDPACSYVALLKYCLSAFNCYDFVGTKYIYFSANDMCYTPKHTRIMMCAAAGLFAYVIGMWMLFYHVIKHLRATRGFGEYCSCSVWVNALKEHACHALQ